MPERLTDAELDALASARQVMTNDELSAEVARRLFGLVPERVECPYHPGSHVTRELYEPYSSDHNAAMGLVVPEMRKRGWAFYVTDRPMGVVQVVFEFLADDSHVAHIAPFGEEPRGICEAALAALDSEEAKS